MNKMAQNFKNQVTMHYKNILHLQDMALSDSSGFILNEVLTH